MKKLSIIILSCLFISISCKEEKKKEEGPTQMEKVMVIHNEAMEKMGQIGKLVEQLKPAADSLGMDSPKAKAMKDLQDAHKAMMDWMQDFGTRFEHEEIMQGKELSEEKKQWLKEEEEKVKEVNDKINSSIAKAESLLQD